MAIDPDNLRSASECEASAEGYASMMVNRDSFGNMTYPEMAQLAQIYATLAVSRRLEQLILLLGGRYG